MSAPGPLASAADRAALAEVLASPEFQAQRWRGDAVRRWLAELWERLTALLGTSEAERWAELGRAVFLIAAAVALLLIWRAARQRRVTAARRGDARPGVVAPVAPRRRPIASVADAERALASGDAPSAVRLAFLAAAGALARRLGVTAAADVLTGAELAGRFSDDGFTRLARLHERTVFGRRPVSAEEASSALAVAVRLTSGPGPGREGREVASLNRAGLAVAVALGAGLLAAVVVTSAPRGDPALVHHPSTESTGNAGVGAAARWLAATGRPYRRLVGDAARPAAGEPWLLLAPAVALDEREVNALIHHARTGGLVVWALGDDAEARQPALSRRLAARRLPGGGDRTVTSLAPHPLFDGLALRAGGAGVASGAPGAVAVLGDAERPAAVAIPFGRGEVVLLAGPEPLDNRHVAQADALSLWVRLSARGPIAFDERFLRLAPAGSRERTGPGALAGLQLGLLALLLAAALWPRLGAVRPPPPERTGRTTRDYLAALAALYRRAGAEPELAASTWRRLRLRLERDAGVAAALSDEEAARRLDQAAPRAAEPLRRGAAALTAGGPGLLLEVARAAADVEAARRGR